MVRLFIHTVLYILSHVTKVNLTKKNSQNIFSLSGQNAREGSPVRTLAIDLIHRREKGRATVASTAVGKQSNCNRHCKVLLTNDPRISTTQFPVGKGAGLGSGIGNQVGRLKRLPD